ncbi:hypothetical protein VPH35_118726 [Triticum aestivum]
MPAGGFSASSARPSGMEFEAKITPMVVTSCVTAATGGLMFGYDIGISGGVTSMEDFQREFFPTVLRKSRENKGSNYCRYDSQGLQLFTSSLYLAGLVSTFFASYTTRRLGRRATMRIAGAFFIVGVIFNGAARDLGMLIVGRILLGCGVGFANQAIPLFLSEIAPTTIRGGLNSLFQLNITVSILFANLVNYGTNSLIERGRQEEGKVVLKKIRGTENVEPEFNEIVEASRITHDIKNPFRSLLQRRNRPLLLITILLQMFQQLTGINAIMFYAPVLLTTLGFKTEASLYSAVITGAVNQGLPTAQTIMVVIIICNFVSSFAWSWGPLGWLVPSETFLLETRSAGQSISVCTNLLFTFVFAQVFLSMLCHLKSFIFVFFSICVAIMSLFKLHWFWKQFMNDGGDNHVISEEEMPSTVSLFDSFVE